MDQENLSVAALAESLMGSVTQLYHAIKEEERAVSAIMLRNGRSMSNPEDLLEKWFAEKLSRTEIRRRESEYVWDHYPNAVTNVFGLIGWSIFAGERDDARYIAKAVHVVSEGVQELQQKLETFLNSAEFANLPENDGVEVTRHTENLKDLFTRTAQTLQEMQSSQAYIDLVYPAFETRGALVFEATGSSFSVAR